MGNFGYNFNVPNAPNDPTDDQPQMLINTVSIGNLIAIDHVGFNTALGGYHTVIHQGNAPSNMDPAKITNIGQLYVKTVTLNAVADQQLFFESGQGIVTQLTSGVAFKGATNGYTFLPGGILIQWGTIAVSAAGTFTPVLFATSNINFPVACFNVVLTMINNQGSSPSVNSLFVRSGSVSNLGFSITNTSGSSTQFAYWIAIGN